MSLKCTKHIITSSSIRMVWYTRDSTGAINVDACSLAWNTHTYTHTYIHTHTYTVYAVYLANWEIMHIGVANKVILSIHCLQYM